MENVARQRSAGMKGLDGAVATRMVEVHALRTSPSAHTTVYRLFILNILLQVFDGVATYSGLHLGIREANPLLVGAFHLWGVVPTLLFFKANACVLLLFVYRLAAEQLAMPALAALAAVYAVCSLIPWLGMLFGLFAYML